MSAIVHGLTPLARVTIPAGTFQMGAKGFSTARPVTEVTLSAFDRSLTKVTVGLYDEYLAAIGGNRLTLGVEDPSTGLVSIVSRGRTERDLLDQYSQSLSVAEKLSHGGIAEIGSFTVFEVTTPRIPTRFKEYPRQPMINFNWWEAAAFAAAHGGRLPTEAQFERVARGRSGTDEYGTVTGELRARNGEKLAHFGEVCTVSVGSYPANSFGVFDACGLVWEWTDTLYQPSYKGLEKQDPQGPRQGDSQVVRGGAYFTIFDVDLHSAHRNIPSVRRNRDKCLGAGVVWRS